jgi:hypothetical protein
MGLQAKTVRYHYIPVRMAKNRNTKTKLATKWKDRRLALSVGGDTNWILWRIITYKIKSIHLTVGIYPKELNICTHSTSMHN